MKIYARENPTSLNKFVGKPVWISVEYYSDGFDEPSDNEYFKVHRIEGDIAQVNMLPAFCIDDLNFHVRSSSSDLKILRDTFTNPLRSDNLYDVNLKFIKIAEPLEILTDEEFLDRIREVCEGKLGL